MPEPPDGQERLEKLRRFLERTYRIEIANMTRLGRGVYRAERTPGPSWVVRVFPEAREVERVRGDAAVLQLLAREGFPSERCAADEPVTNPAGRGVLVTEFEEGGAAEHTAKCSRWLGSAMGRLATLLPDSGKVSRPAGALHVLDPNGGLPADEIRAARTWLEEFERSIPTGAKPAYLRLREYLATADDASGLPLALVHPDAVAPNVISTRSHDLRLIDRTGAGVGPRLWGIVWTIWASGLGGRPKSLEHVRAAVEGYRTSVELEPEELERLPKAMSVRPRVLAAFRIRRAVRAGRPLDGREWWWRDEKYATAVAEGAQAAFRSARPD